MRSPAHGVTVLAALFATLCVARSLAAQAQTGVATPPDPRTSQIRALIDESLDVAVAPQSLFDVPLGDEAAIRIEAARLRALLVAAEAAAKPEGASSRRRAAAPAAPGEGQLRSELARLAPASWSGRLDLDRARLEFYALEPERRTELLAAHAARQEAARPQETEEERRAREVEEERARALEAARVARSEAERLVAEEVARLIALEEQVHVVRESFRHEREELDERRDVVLGWQRRVREAKAAGHADADATYDALRRVLRVSRDELTTALDVLDDDATAVPAIGPRRLTEVPLEVSEAARERRVAAEAAVAEALRDERDLREHRATLLLGEIDVLNRERLDLLSGLSSSKRDAITGFTVAGWDQARSEARHLSLILRYHRHATVSWLNEVRAGTTGVSSAWRTIVVALPLIVLVGVFVWARRRTPSLLRWADARLGAADRAERRTGPSPRRRLVRVLIRTHRPLEWIVFFFVVHSLLSQAAHDLLEFQLVASVIRWTLIGALAVDLINTVAARDTSGLVLLDEGEAGALRLRSLRLVSRTIVGFALILVLSARLVGEGTIYSWVFSTCWFAAVPVFLLLVRWWRSSVCDRLDRVRKKTPFQAWVLANRSGWKSFLAAMLGAVMLFSTGTVKTIRAWISSFDLARRAHAYLFRREIERMGGDKGRVKLAGLSPDALAYLHPERLPSTWLACPADELRASFEERVASRRGGVIAVVGARGMGKSSLLRAATAEGERAVFLSCSNASFQDELRVLTRRAWSEEEAPSIVVIDDAHLLVQPRIGGLEPFDDLIAFARHHSVTTTWLFALDAALWPLLKRARDARPLFDETHVLAPWREEEIGALTANRSELAGFSPSYDDLLDQLPLGADEIDRQDALRAKRMAYERMLWDHVGGNPGLALEAWRSSLGVDPAGVVHVRPLQVPDIAKLELLPDSSLFVLRAVLQLAPTSFETVAQATRLRVEEVVQDVRFGKASGLYEQDGESVRVAWPWMRAVTRFLERRHLLVSP